VSETLTLNSLTPAELLRESLPKLAEVNFGNSEKYLNFYLQNFCDISRDILGSTQLGSTPHGRAQSYLLSIVSRKVTERSGISPTILKYYLLLSYGAETPPKLRKVQRPNTDRVTTDLVEFIRSIKQPNTVELERIEAPLYEPEDIQALFDSGMHNYQIAEKIGRSIGEVIKLKQTMKKKNRKRL